METPHELSETVSHHKTPNPAFESTPSETSLTPHPQPSPNSPTLTIDFSWRNLQARITSNETPQTPLYIIDAPITLKSPHLTFHHANPNGSNDSSTFGTANLHAISIHADCTLHGHHLKLHPLKKLKTAYTHLSSAYSHTPGELVPMTWTTTCTLKLWEFICLDANGNAVAKFAARIWATSRLGAIEFLGEGGARRECREEVVVVVCTLYYLMVVRSGNPLRLVGAMFARTGTIGQGG
ncbi:hypothetical protein Vi05172_g9670 [Venturia inaequalis]|nr:hypothetical protein Vi05172_g9670 [Venturia inaequalis]